MKSKSRLIVAAGEDSHASNNFDLIRISMAMLVVWSHSFALYRGSEAGEPLSLLTNGIINCGNLGVFVFFMVSGYLITQSFERSSTPWSYLKKRIARIYPGFLVATSVCAFVILPLVSSRVRYTPFLVTKTIGLNLLLQGYFVDNAPFTRNPMAALNGALWSIPFEFWCYIGVLTLGLLGLLKATRRSVLLLLLVAVSLVRGWLEISGRKPGGGVIGLIIGWPYLWFKLLPCFLVGMIVYRYRDTLPRLRSIAFLAPLCVILCAHLPMAAVWKTVLVSAFFPPAVGYSVFYFAFSKQLLNIGRWGDFSYGAYLYAFPLQQIVMAEFGKSLPFPLYILVCMILALCAGVLSWFGVERWFNLSKLRRGRRVDGQAVELIDLASAPAEIVT